MKTKASKIRSSPDKVWFVKFKGRKIAGPYNHQETAMVIRDNMWSEGTFSDNADLRIVSENKMEHILDAEELVQKSAAMIFRAAKKPGMLQILEELLAVNKDIRDLLQKQEDRIREKEERHQAYEDRRMGNSSNVS